MMEPEAVKEVIDTSYEPFSREPEYIEANRAFLRTLALRPKIRVLDLACGTGTMTDLLLEQLNISREGETGSKSTGDVARVVGIDLSRKSLLLAQKHLEGLGFLHPPGPSDLPSKHQRLNIVGLVEGTADCLPVADGVVDLVMMGNAVQLVSDLDALFSEINRILKPGGLYAFNTSFYAGTYVPGTEHVYTIWIQEALLYIRTRDTELRGAGLPGVTRKRGLGSRAFSKPWLSAAQYKERMEGHNLVVTSTMERTVMLTQRSFETIGAYAGLAQVLLSGYPVRLACEALEKAAGPALDTAGVKAVPRYWLEMVAQKGAGHGNRHG